MNQSKSVDFFNKEASTSYDEKNRQLAPIADCMHFLIRLLLKDLAQSTHVLCVGVGTGAEILSLALEFPQWTFLGVDPSASMLDVCRERLKVAGVLDRCELVHGYVHELPVGENFDVALSILVGHFIKREERLDYYKAMIIRLRTKGYLVNTEISFDLNSPESTAMIKGWAQVQMKLGATPESITNLPYVLKETLSVISPTETEYLLTQSGIHLPLRFFQALMIIGWYGQKI